MANQSFTQRLTALKAYDERLLAPMLQRLVYSFYYPAILAANLLLLFRQAGVEWALLSWADLPVRLAWVVTLLLFILDYVGTASDDLSGAPRGNSFLFVIDGFAATIFFYAQTKLLGFETVQLVENVDWQNLWFALAALHILYAAWYGVRLLTAEWAFPKGHEQLGRYKQYWLRQFIAVAIQGILFFLISWAVWPPGPWAYSSLCIIAIVAWVLRQIIEYKHHLTPPEDLVER